MPNAMCRINLLTQANLEQDLAAKDRELAQLFQDHRDLLSQHQEYKLVGLRFPLCGAFAL